MFRITHLTRAHLLLLALVLGLIGTLPTPPSAGAQSLPPTTAPTPLPNERPDACEPNGDARRACALPMDAVSGPFTLLPEGDQDFYSTNLGTAPNGLETTVTVRGTSGLDLLTTITRADTGATLATIASPAISATLAADLTGWIILHVENRAPNLALGQSYRVELRRTLPPTPLDATPSGPEGLNRQPAEPDSLENNYSPETAAPMAVGVLYDLTLVCPIENGCPGGDHDYFRFEAKAGTRYLITAFDLAPGVDTVLDLFWPNPGQGWSLLASNDDARPGAAFLSVLRWQAPGDGPVTIRVGPRDGGLNPVRTESDPAPSYRLAVALADSPLAAQLEERIAKQTGAPDPVPTAGPAAGVQDRESDPSPIADAAPTPASVTSGATSGEVYLVEPAQALIAPDPASAVLAELAVDSILTTTGMVSGLYVEVTSTSFVGPGWVNRRALRPATSSPEPAPATSADAAPPDLTAQAGEAPALEPAAGSEVLPVRAMAPLPLDAPAAARNPIPVQVEVTVTSAAGVGVAGLRLTLSNVFGDHYVETLTGADGRATLTTVVPPGEALLLLCPDLGVTHQVSDEQTTVSITLPEAKP